MTIIRIIWAAMLSSLGIYLHACHRLAAQLPAVGRYTVATVVSLALAESVGIYGMVLFLLGADFRTLYLFMAVSAATMVFYRPTMEEMENLAVAMKVSPWRNRDGQAAAGRRTLRRSHRRCP